MRTSSKTLMLAGASAIALGVGAAPAKAQLITFGDGSISAPNASSGVSIGLLASQINTSLTGSAVVNNGAGITTTPGGASAADATTSVTANTISATMAGNVAGPATGEIYTVNLAGMSSDGTGSAATTAYQLNTAPNVLAGVGVDSSGASTGAAQTVGSTFSTQLTSSSAVTGNVIGSTAVGNQAANVAGGATPGAGTAGSSASIGVFGAQQQRTNTLNYNNFVSADSAVDFTATGAQTMPAGGVATAGTLIYVTSLGTGAAASAYYTSTAPAPTTGTYSTVADPGGSVTGVIAATTLQRNTDLASTGGIRAVTDSASVSAVLQSGASSATLDNSLNAVSSAATGNTATTGIAVTGGAPTLNGGLAVLNEQVNATSGSAAAGISATTNGSTVTTALGATGGTSLASSSVLMEGNQVSAAATGSAATNTLTATGLVRLGAAGTPTAGNGAGSLSTGALLSQERLYSTETVASGDPSPSPLPTYSSYTTVSADSSGVAPNYQSASAVADYLAANIQRNSGSATAPLAVTANVTGGGITLGTTADTSGATATASAIGLTGNSVAASATGARATTSIGNGTATLLGDGATMAALSLQEAASTSTRAQVSGSGIAVALGSDAAGAATAGGVLSGGTVTVGSNTVSATGVSNIATTSLSNVAASGGTLSSGATYTSALRSDTTGTNVDVSYTAPLAAISSQRLTSAVTGGADATIASAVVSNTDITLGLAQDVTSGSATSATGSTIALTGNRTLANAGGNQSTVGVSFAEGSGSLLPGGAVAGNSQILAPTATGTGITASITGSSMQVAATVDVGGTPTVTASTLAGGSVTASNNRVASQAIGNQGAGSITSSSLLIAGGAGGAGATASLNNGSASDTATASYLLANTQQAAPSTGTMAISSSVTDGSVSVLGGGNAATVSLDGNVVSSVGAANVFTGAVTGLSSTGSATQLAVSQQDVAGVSVSSALSGAAAVYSIGGSSLTGIDATTVPAAFASGTASVSGNTLRALSVMNEAGLSVTGAGVADLGTTGGGRIATATLDGSSMTLSGFEAGAANQQVVSLDNSGTVTSAGAYGVSSTSGARVGVNGGSTSVGFTGATLGVAGNTVDARTLGNTAVVTTSGDAFAGGVGVVNSQAVSQGGSNTLAGLSASNTGTTVGVGTDGLAPPVGTSSMSVANNTVSASTAANDAQLQIAALTSGSLGNANLNTRAVSDVSLSTSGGSTAFLGGVDADYLAANVQTTSNLRARSTVGGSAAGEGVSILAAASTVTGTTAVTGNRIAAETVGNRAAASMSLPALNAGYVQTASYQANTGGNFASHVVNARVGFADSTPSTAVRSTAAVSNNTILASAQGNVFNGSMAIPMAGANYAQSAAQQVNNGTSIAASVTGATVNVAGAGGMASTSLSGNTVGASAMGNVLRATVGAR